jgi:hypothetical protein
MSAREFIQEYTKLPYVGIFQYKSLTTKHLKRTNEKGTQTDPCKAIEIGDKIIEAYGDGWEEL